MTIILKRKNSSIVDYHFGVCVDPVLDENGFTSAKPKRTVKGVNPNTHTMEKLPDFLPSDTLFVSGALSYESGNWTVTDQAAYDQAAKLEKAKAQAQAKDQFLRYGDSLQSRILKNYLLAEPTGWESKEASARAYLGGSTDENFYRIQAEAAANESEDLTALCQNIVGQGQLFGAFNSFLTGKRRKCARLVDNCSHWYEPPQVFTSIVEEVNFEISQELDEEGNVVRTGDYYLLFAN